MIAKILGVWIMLTGAGFGTFVLLSMDLRHRDNVGVTAMALAMCLALIATGAHVYKL